MKKGQETTVLCIYFRESSLRVFKYSVILHSFGIRYIYDIFIDDRNTFLQGTRVSRVYVKLYQIDDRSRFLILRLKSNLLK